MELHQIIELAKPHTTGRLYEYKGVAGWKQSYLNHGYLVMVKNSMNNSTGELYEAAADFVMQYYDQFKKDGALLSINSDPLGRIWTVALVVHIFEFETAKLTAGMLNHSAVWDLAANTDINIWENKEEN